jgi:DNA-directed RNA polymerase subunit RPC12/RpoP
MIQISVIQISVVIGNGNMAWYRNHYVCARCDREWEDEWSCMCDDDCPNCGARHMSPYDADNLTFVVERDGAEFVVLHSPGSAEHCPSYGEIARFKSRKKAEAFMVRRL